MFLDERDYMRSEHPLACSCVECVAERLRRLESNWRDTLLRPKGYKAPKKISWFSKLWKG